ncbi:MAG: class I SAM-dependent methyltransferase [Mycoplasma sp.]
MQINNTSTSHATKEFWDKEAERFVSLWGLKNLPIITTLCNCVGIDNKKSILEVGCGSGDGAKFMTISCQNPCIIYSLDFSESMLNFAENLFSKYDNFNKNNVNSYERLPKPKENEKIKIRTDYQQGTHVKFVEGNCESLPFENEQFDAYVSSLCLQITLDYKNALKEMFRVLKKGGKFAIGIWGKRERTTCRIIEEVCLRHGFEINSYRNYKMGENDKELVSICEEIGFTNVRFQYFDVIRETIYQESNNFTSQKQILNQLEKVREKDPKKAKEIEDEIKNEIHQFISVDKNVPVFNWWIVFGDKL